MNDPDRKLVEQMAAWHRDFNLSEELQFRFQSVSKYVRRRLREHYDGNPAFRSRFPEFRDFEKHAIRIGSDLMSTDRQRARLEKERRIDNRLQAPGRSRLQKFTDHLLRK